MCCLPFTLFPAVAESPLNQVSGACSHKGPCALNRSIHSTKGIWNLALGGGHLAQEQLFSRLRLPVAIGLWGISCPTPHLTQAGCCLSLQLEQPVLRPGSAGDAPVPSFLLALAQPTATRISLLSREQPQETKLASGQTWGRGHKLF